MTSELPDQPVGFDDLVAELARLGGHRDDVEVLTATLEAIAAEVASGGPPDRDALWRDVQRRIGLEGS